jgi:magnesium-protoporphyrin IX monomethyl ester (oxidative) cyclase
VIDGAVAARRDLDPPRASVWSVDAIPTPDYDDYFTALDRSPLRAAVTPALVVETSRGCWWGAKSHCTFCGLNGGNMAFRAKSPERAALEFQRLAARYGVRRFTVVDNIIDMQYHRTMLPLLAGRGYDIFYETKANLRRHHIQSFFDAGVRSIQPGIESLHDELLHLLAKGNKAWMNVQLLKWAAELAMDVSWVFLIDIPGQRDAAYIEMLTWLPLVSHLPPPSFAVPIQFMRFSPYHRDAAAYGFDLAPEPAYAQVYPLGEEELRELAYEFVDRRAPAEEGIGQRLLLAWLGLWREEHQNGTRPLLEMRRDGGAIDIADTRSCRTADRHRLDGDAARLYAACDEAVDRAALRERLGIARFDDVVDALRADKILLELSGRLLALAVDATRPRPAELPSPGGRIEWALVP